jgi:RimJ/RimL family protein N-acetyltransferase
MCTFRKLDESDLELLFNWLQQPHVKEWWDDGDDTIEKVRVHYSQEADIVNRYILLKENQPIGYFQSYPEADNVIGIDQFIGELSFINRGHGTEAVMNFTNLVKESDQPRAIIVDPDPENHRAIRCYEKAGFRYQELVVGVDGKQACLMRMEIDV